MGEVNCKFLLKVGWLFFNFYVMFVFDDIVYDFFFDFDDLEDYVI